jgi:hypothetical protein
LFAKEGSYARAVSESGPFSFATERTEDIVCCERGFLLVFFSVICQVGLATKKQWRDLGWVSQTESGERADVVEI